MRAGLHVLKCYIFKNGETSPWQGGHAKIRPIIIREEVFQENISGVNLLVCRPHCFLMLPFVRENAVWSMALTRRSVLCRATQFLPYAMVVAFLVLAVVIAVRACFLSAHDVVVSF